MKWLRRVAATAALAAGFWVGGLAAVYVSGYLLDRLDIVAVTGDSSAELALGVTWPMYPATALFLVGAWLLLARPRRFWIACVVTLALQALVWLALREGWLPALTAIAAGIACAAVFAGPRFSRQSD